VINGLPVNPITNSNGSYTATVACGWSGTVTLAKAGCHFGPPSRSYSNVTSNQTGDYVTTLETRTISGYVKQYGNPLSGVRMAGLPVNSTTTDANGYYIGTVDYGWSGTVMPRKLNTIFSPESSTYNNVTSNLTTNYTAEAIPTTTAPPVTFTISGYVYLYGNPLSGATLNGLPGNPTTNSSGYYSATVPYGWSGTVTPQYSYFVFSPKNSSYSNVTLNITANYNAAPY
jgi:hypothetical protein